MAERRARVGLSSRKNGTSAMAATTKVATTHRTPAQLARMDSAFPRASTVVKTSAKPRYAMGIWKGGYKHRTELTELINRRRLAPIRCSADRGSIKTNAATIATAQDESISGSIGGQENHHWT